MVTHVLFGIEIGGFYSTMGIASLFMPGLLGIVADRWINAERVMGICHLIGAATLIYATTVTDYSTFYVLMLLNALVYMPTIALNNSVSYSVLEQKNYDVIKDFPPIRVWGTVGFILAMWVVDLMGWTKSKEQLIVSSIAALVLGFYVFTLPATPPLQKQKSKSFMSA